MDSIGTYLLDQRWINYLYKVQIFIAWEKLDAWDLQVGRTDSLNLKKKKQSSRMAAFFFLNDNIKKSLKKGNSKLKVLKLESSVN